MNTFRIGDRVSHDEYRGKTLIRTRYGRIRGIYRVKNELVYTIQWDGDSNYSPGYFGFGLRPAVDAPV